MGLASPSASVQCDALLAEVLILGRTVVYVRIYRGQGLILEACREVLQAIALELFEKKMPV